MEFLWNENGQSMVEYALIIGLIAVVVIASLVLLGPRITDIFNKSGEALTSND